MDEGEEDRWKRGNFTTAGEKERPALGDPGAVSQCVKESMEIKRRVEKKKRSI